MLKRTILLALAVALLAALAIPVSASAAAQPEALAAKKGKAKGKKCPKGFVQKTVRKNGKNVKKCRKKKGSKTPVSVPGTPPASLFEAPGQRLEGEAAKPFLQKYLANSTFTDCPAGWPNCAVEQRYSHTSSGSFYYCRLTSVSGADIINGARGYQVKNAVVNADGSWLFNEDVEGGGFYEWSVSTTGVVTGAYSFNGGSFEQLGPFAYLGGIAKDCSY